MPSTAPASAGELASAAGIHERYAREWLEQQAVSAILDVIETEDGIRRFVLPVGHAEALLDEESLNYASPFGRLLVACLRPIEALLDAYRQGGGVPYADYGADLHEGQSAFTRPLFSRLLAQEWLPSVAEIHARLLADPPARVADVACGGGFSSIAIARGYPKVHVDGIDLDTASIELARRHLAGSSVEDRVTFEARDAADPALGRRYDLVTVFEALHDMSYPVDVLRAARGMLAEGGVVLVGDERTAESFGAPGDDLERMYYGFSILHCLPVGTARSAPAPSCARQRSRPTPATQASRTSR